jgi:hypothetical protein
LSATRISPKTPPSGAALLSAEGRKLVHEVSGGCQPTILVCAQSHAAVHGVIIVLAYAPSSNGSGAGPSILAQWTAVGVLPIVAALVLLTSTYFLRTWRIYDYFPHETRGRFGRCFASRRCTTC